jgi:DNA-binding response OmpR family regulator
MADHTIDAVPNTRSPNRSRSDVYPKAQHLAPRRVLVVDDEPLIRLFVARALKASGYDVIQADSAERAVELLTTEGHTLSLLLSDIGLPGASGVELVQYARRFFPDLPAQLMSATSRQCLVSEGLLSATAHVLQKPFKVADLLSRIDQLLAR